MELYRVLPSPLPGLALLLAETRWFAPPAKIRCPSGTIKFELRISNFVRQHSSLR
jgi:hypothetical protein